MKKRLSLLSCLIIGSVGTNAQVVQNDLRNVANTMSVTETLNWDKYGAGKQSANVPFKSVIHTGKRASSNSTGIVLGESKYDLMTNSAIDNRFVRHSDGTFSAAFTMSDQAGPAYANRGTGYLYHNGTSWTISKPTSRIESERVGWPSLGYTANGDEIVMSHSTDNDVLMMLTRSGKGAGTWTETKDPTGAAQNPKVGSGYLVWPRMVIAGKDGNTVHMIGLTEPTGTNFNGVIYQGMDGALVYSRSEDGGKTWNIKNQLLKGINGSVYASIGGDSYAIAAKDDIVAIAVFHRFGDVRVLKSEDNGNTWETHIPLDFAHDAFTLGDFAILDTPTTSDNSGDILIDKNGEVNLFFGSWRWTDDDPTDDQYNVFQFASGIEFWKESYGDNNYQRIAGMIDVDGNGQFNIAGYPPSFDGLTNYGSKSVNSFPSVGMNAQGDLFLKFTAVMEDVSLTGGKTYNNGSRHYRHEWVTRSNDGGCTWSNPVDLTDDGSGFEECVYGVIPKDVDSKFRMIYMEDGNPGTAVGPEAHANTNNEMVYIEMNTSNISSNKDICLTAIKGSLELCPGDTTMLDASPSCGSAYDWKNSAGVSISTVATAEITVAGTYTCDITTPCGVIQRRIEVQRPVLGQGPKIKLTSSLNAICASGSQATLKVAASAFGSSGTITWDKGIPGVVDSFVVTKPGVYEVEVASCSGTTTETISIDTIKKADASIVGKTFICPGDNAILSVKEQPNATYTWEDGSGGSIGSTRSVTVSSTGTYNVTVTACGGSLTANSSISVASEPTPTASIAAVGDVKVCKGSVATIDLKATGQTGATFKWSNGSTGNLVSVPGDVVGTTVLSCHSFNACGDSTKSNELTVEVVDLPLAPTVNDDGATTLTAKNATGIKWYYKTKTSTKWVATGETGQVFTPKAGKYPRGTKFAATFTDATTGCESDYAEGNLTIGVDQFEFNNNAVSVYPNPNNGTFTLSFAGINSKTTLNIALNNTLGQTVYSSTLNLTSDYSEEIALDNVEKGVYFLNVDNGNETATYQIVVQ